MDVKRCCTRFGEGQWRRQGFGKGQGLWHGFGKGQVLRDGGRDNGGSGGNQGNRGRPL